MVQNLDHIYDLSFKIMQVFSKKRGRLIIDLANHFGTFFHVGGRKSFSPLLYFTSLHGSEYLTPIIYIIYL